MAFFFFLNIKSHNKKPFLKIPTTHIYNRLKSQLNKEPLATHSKIQILDALILKQILSTYRKGASLLKPQDLNCEVTEVGLENLFSVFFYPGQFVW